MTEVEKVERKQLVMNRQLSTCQEFSEIFGVLVYAMRVNWKDFQAHCLSHGPRETLHETFYVNKFNAESERVLRVDGFNRKLG